jgi:TRAP-type C4-dicarboxylate transport system permease small subunit
MDSDWKFLRRITSGMRSTGALMLVAMTVLTCVDVIGRLFKHPVFGSVELMSLMGALTVAMALPDTHAARGHIGVELFVNRLPGKPRAVVALISGLMSLILFFLVSWQMLEYSVKMMKSGEVSMNLSLPEYLIIFSVAVGFTVFTVAIAKDVVDAMGKLREK